MNDRFLYSKNKYSSAFTIVELLIVVVVVAILAAISIVSYNGITAQAEESALKSALQTASNKVLIEQVKGGVYPENLPSDIETDTGIYTLQYTGGQSYCITAFSKKNTDKAFHVSSEEGGIQSGKCDEHLAIGEIETTPEACFEFNPSSKTITYYYYNEGNNSANPACPRDVVIPSKIGGVDVDIIGHGSFRDRQLTSVTIPSSVYLISDTAFESNRLTSIAIPDTVVAIDILAFRDNQLTSVFIPDSVDDIAPTAFESNQLGNVSLPSHLSSHESDPDLSFSDNPNLTFTIRP